MISKFEEGKKKKRERRKVCTSEEEGNLVKSPEEANSE